MTAYATDNFAKPSQLNEKLSQFVKHIKKQDPYYNAVKTQLILESRDVYKTFSVAGKNMEFLEQQLAQLEQENEMLQQENDALRTENNLLADELSKSALGVIYASRSKFGSTYQSAAGLIDRALGIKKELSDIIAILFYIKDNMLRNQRVFNQFISQLGDFVKSELMRQNGQLQENTLNLSLLKSQKVIETMRRDDYCFPTMQQAELLLNSFKPKEKQYLSQNFGADDIQLFLDQILTKLECSAQELMENWTKDVELFVKEEIKTEFGIQEDLHISKSQNGLYLTDQKDDLVTCWLMAQVFTLIGHLAGAWK